MKDAPSLKEQEVLLSNIKKLKQKYDEKRNKDRFNIFYALHKEHDEVNLHSRFISYLLAKDSGHMKGDLFARLFLDIVLKKDKDFLDDYVVIPNEFNKTEFKEIDILLINKKLKHAIVIENKIYAKDSNHDHKEEEKVVDGYIGQLERYYNTILKGTPKKSANKSEKITFETHDYISNKIDVFYLTLNKPKEDTFTKSKGNIPESVGVREIYYKDEIIKWLKHCLEVTKDDNFLNKIINQYLILVKNMTKTNIPKKELNELRNLYSTNLETTRYVIDNFKDIKWHTVDDFLIKLKNELKSNGYKNVCLYPENNDARIKLVTELTHNNKDVNIGVTFKTNEGENLYISVLNNLSWGIVDRKWTDFTHNLLQNIRFSDFSTENTYNLIDQNNTTNAIKSIIKEISEEQENNFDTLKSI
ncbi:PD-(D/E)XK nuclease family protein [Lutibacter sp. A64]|uniref:PD-(D/E)XK nuclease family protein n=1 Tax=Lutibacter sp. A64 TaxID=2918526 RepID=UPI001F06B881|nr:PD-(D/E)XK nuclease family protein [Lutibacter sp. A64]UMB52959.1 PD-(D/E)XK nuclease family protein [Lutibacter sp. A64]